MLSNAAKFVGAAALPVAVAPARRLDRVLPSDRMLPLDRGQGNSPSAGIRGGHVAAIPISTADTHSKPTVNHFGSSLGTATRYQLPVLESTPGCYHILVDGAACGASHQELGRCPTPTCFSGQGGGSRKGGCGPGGNETEPATSVCPRRN